MRLNKDALLELWPAYSHVSTDMLNKCLELINNTDVLLWSRATVLQPKPVIAVFTRQNYAYWLAAFETVDEAQQFADKLSLPLEEAKECN